MSKDSTTRLIETIIIISVAFFFAFIQMISDSITSPQTQEIIGLMSVGLLALALVTIFNRVRRSIAAKKKPSEF